MICIMDPRFSMFSEFEHYEDYDEYIYDDEIKSRTGSLMGRS